MRIIPTASCTSDGHPTTAPLPARADAILGVYSDAQSECAARLLPEDRLGEVRRAACMGGRGSHSQQLMRLQRVCVEQQQYVTPSTAVLTWSTLSLPYVNLVIAAPISLQVRVEQMVRRGLAGHCMVQVSGGTAQPAHAAAGVARRLRIGALAFSPPRRLQGCLWPGTHPGPSGHPSLQLIWALDVGRATRGALAATIANLHKMMGSHNHPTELIWHFIVSAGGGRFAALVTHLGSTEVGAVTTPCRACRL